MIRDLASLALTMSINSVTSAVHGAIKRLADLLPHGPKRLVTANCCQCGRIVDTREMHEGGDAFGCQLNDGRWTCSFECWDEVVGE